MVRAIAFTLLCCLEPAASVPSHELDCASLGAASSQLRVEWRSMPVTIAIPEDGVIEDFRVGTLYRSDHSRFVPSTVSEAVCVIERSLEPPVLKAIVAGAKQGEMSGRGLEFEEQMESVYREVGEQLDLLYSDSGLPKGSGLTKVLWHLQNEIAVNSLSYPSQLQVATQNLGIYSANHVAWYVLAEFLNGKGVDPEFTGNLITHMRAKDRSIAPPATLRPRNCEGGIQYLWPTVSLPIASFKDVASDENVHWGICKSTQSVWVYHFSSGWIEASQEEIPKVCERFGDRSDFARACLPMDRPFGAGSITSF